MDYEKRVKEFVPILRVHQVDGSQKLTETKKLAVGYVLDQYERVSLKEVKKDPELRTAMEHDFVAFYEALEGKNPQPQSIYLDFSSFKSFYEDNLEAIFKQPFPVWKRDYILELKRRFRLPSREKLAIHFMTEKPAGTPYTTVVLSPEDFDDYMYSNDRRSAQLVSWKLSNPGEDRKKTKAIIKRVTRKLPKGTSVEKKMAKAAKDPEFRTMVGRGGFGLSLRMTELEFGNPTPDDLVWIGAGRLYDAFNKAQDTPTGNMISIASYSPWIGKNNGENLTKAFAETTAHEIGHALGIRHPSVSLEYVKGPTAMPMASAKALQYINFLPPEMRESIIWMRENAHLMHTTLGRDHIRPATPKFNEFTLDYFRFILGVQPKAN